MTYFRKHLPVILAVVFSLSSLCLAEVRQDGSIRLILNPKDASQAHSSSGMPIMPFLFSAAYTAQFPIYFDQ